MAVIFIAVIILTVIIIISIINTMTIMMINADFYCYLDYVTVVLNKLRGRGKLIARPVVESQYQRGAPPPSARSATPPPWSLFFSALSTHRSLL